MSPSHVLPPRIKIPEVIATNTLIVTNLEREAFLPENLVEIRDRLERHGKIYKIVPIKSFNRILAIFYQSNDARNAKRYCDKIEFLDKTIRIYHGQHTPINDEIDNSNHLNVPELEKNWLVSPPGSPPVGWTPIREDRPNSNTLADDLVHALAHVSLNTNIADYDDITDLSLDDDNTNQDNNDNNIPRMQTPILTVVPSDSDSCQGNVEVPLILIQDWDDSGLQGNKKTNKRNFNLQQTKARLYPTLAQHPIMPTPRPPLLFS